MWGVWQLWVWVEEKHDGSLVQAGRVYAINNSMVLVGCCRSSTVATRAVWAFSGISRSSG